VLLLKALKTRIQQRFGFCLQPDPGLPQQRTIMAAPLRRDMHAHALVRLLVDNNVRFQCVALLLA